MASWKKVLVSGSSIDVNQITASGVPTVDNESNLLALSTDGGITHLLLMELIVLLLLLLILLQPVH